MSTFRQPWVSGHAEILQHGLKLLDDDSDSNRRLAMLSIDNSGASSGKCCYLIKNT